MADDPDDQEADAETYRPITHKSPRRGFLHRQWVVGIGTGIIIFILGGLATNLYHDDQASAELHNLGARYNVTGFTISLTSITCVEQKQSQNCTARFNEINDTDSSNSLGIDIVLFVGPSRYADDYDEELNNLFPNAEETRYHTFTIAPGAEPTKLELAPESPSFWSWLPFDHQHFYYDLRGVVQTNS